MTDPFYAHSRENRPKSEWELLIDHLRGVEKRAAQHADAFGSAPWGALIGRWHDLGKYLREFQDRLDGNPERVDHASPGAALASEVGGVIGKALAFVIAGHHAGLANSASRENTRQRPLDERLAAAAGNLKRVREVAAPELTTIERPSLPTFLQRLPTRTSSEKDRSYRRLEFWTRFLFSALVDADRLETARFYGSEAVRNREFDSISTLRERLDRKLDGFAADTPVNQMRARVLADCRARAELPPGLFSLSVPTGGGKTLSGMAFALRHAELHELRRVVVAIPYTSIIEQNAAIYADVLGPENVIEHHSAIDEQQAMEGDREREIRRRLAAENWDAPVVVTTNVQFFESLFSNEPSRCRKLHNLARSVIVLDEAQALPPEFLDCALDALRELVDVYGCSVVLCTATQPALTRRESLPMGFEPGAVREIINEPRALAHALERVRVHWPEPGVVTSYEDLAPRITDHDRVLAIVHLRKDARTLAKLLPPEHRFHLSGLMCAAHRTEVLAEATARLEAKLSCRLVSTQLIEAGVDVDFPVVFRSFAGLDSVAQAAGRCNRNGKLERGDLFVFLAETSPPPGLLRIGLESAGAMLAARGTDLRITGAEQMEEYFRIYYGKCKTDGNGVQPERERLNFATVADRVRLIEDDWSTPVVVPWGDAMERVHRHEANPTRETARALQRYIVQVSKKVVEQEIASGSSLSKLGESLHVLSPTHAHLYDPEFGLLLGEE